MAGKSASPDYKRIAALETDLFGRVYTAEAKRHAEPTFPYVGSFGSRLRESDATQQARANHMDDLLLEFGVD